MALRRYREAAVLHDKIGQLEGALERRVGDRAREGMLMERYGVDEREAFERLCDHPRATSRRIVDVAEGVLDGHVLRPRG